MGPDARVPAERIQPTSPLAGGVPREPLAAALQNADNPPRALVGKRKALRERALHTLRD